MCMDKNYFLSITHTEFVVVIYVLTNVPLKFHSKWSRTFSPKKLMIDWPIETNIYKRIVIFLFNSANNFMSHNTLKTLSGSGLRYIKPKRAY